MQPLTAPPLKFLEFLGQVIDNGTLFRKETDAVVIPKIIADIHAENGDRLVVGQQLPGYRCNMVDIVEVSYKENQHGGISYDFTGNLTAIVPIISAFTKPTGRKTIMPLTGFDLERVGRQFAEL
jgi:hypothetical protein